MAFELILTDFPEVKTAFAYGSAVFAQKDNKDEKNMLDVIFIVDDANSWHRTNLEMNNSHYAWLTRTAGSNFISYLQENLGANTYYNTLVPWNGRVIKYGIITESDLIDDLLNWQSLYISGRLHKPVKFFRPASGDLQYALGMNLKHALRTSLLCLPTQFLDEDLFMQITKLSYYGDFRMVIGENKNKVSNIVKPNIAHFRELYLPHLVRERSIDIDGNIVHQNDDVETRYERLTSLPRNLKSRIVNCKMVGLKIEPFNSPSKEMQDAILYSLAGDKEETRKLVQRGTRSLVRKTSSTQSLKGILTAGAYKSVIYSGKKFTKMLRGMLR